MGSFTLHDLENIIADRAGKPASVSWTAKLLEKGIGKASQKMGEEAVEAVIAAVTGNREELIKETADLFYHVLVVLKASDVALEDVLAELERRTCKSGLEEKASRSGG